MLGTYIKDICSYRHQLKNIADVLIAPSDCSENGHRHFSLKTVYFTDKRHISPTGADEDFFPRYLLSEPNISTRTSDDSVLKMMMMLVMQLTHILPSHTPSRTIRIPYLADGVINHHF